MGVVAVEWRGREGKEIGGGAQEEGTEREGRREWWGGEGKEEGRGGRGWGGGRKGLREGVRWVVLGDPLLPAFLPASGVQKVGIVLCVHESQCPGKGLVLDTRRQHVWV